MAESDIQSPVLRYAERIGRAAVSGIEELGTCGVLVVESLYWLVAGPRLRQPVRINAIFVQMMEVGIHAVPIVAMMAGTIGVMLAIQGIHTLKIFGAESRVVVGIAFSVVREFAPLITGIIVAGRSGSALAARLAFLLLITPASCSIWSPFRITVSMPSCREAATRISWTSPLDLPEPMVPSCTSAGPAS